MALLELLLRKDNRAYISFYNALVKEAYDDLANLLHDDLPRMLPDARKSSSDDCTPYGEKRKLWGRMFSLLWLDMSGYKSLDTFNLLLCPPVC